MRTKTIELFQYSELSDAAKSKARDWYREASAGDSDFGEPIVDDFLTIAGFCGWTVRTRDASFTSVTGKRIVKTNPCVSWQVGYMQSDGASFDGGWSAESVNVAGLKEHAPQDAELHSIGERFAEIADANPDGSATVSERSWEAYGDYSDDLRTATRDLTCWLYEALRAECDYQTSDECVADTIEANEYEFTADGERA